MEFILEVQAISFFLNINILITVSIIHMSAWVLPGYMKFINTLLIPDIGIPIASLCSHVD